MLASALTIASGGLACAEVEEAATNALTARPSAAWRPITSHNRHFVVSGFPPADALNIAVWAENVYERLSGWAQSPVPGGFAYPLTITAVLTETGIVGRAVASQSYTEDGHFRQELAMVNPAAMDQEDALEQLTQLLLNRWIYSKSRGKRDRDVRQSYPDWMGVGVAQNLYPELRTRNYELVKKEEMSAGAFAMPDVLGYRHLPPGRWPEKARAALVIAWLSDQVGPANLLAMTSSDLADSGTLDLSYFLQITGNADVREMSMAWDLWMARQERRFVPGMMVSDTEELSRILELRSEDIGLLHQNYPPGSRLSVDILLENREDEWARDASSKIAWNLRQEMIGKTTAIHEKANALAEVFDGIAGNAAPTSKKKTKTVSSRTLRAKWKAAWRDWATFLEDESKRRAYLDEYAAVAGSGAVTSTNAVRAMLQKWAPDSEP